ncbi:hypothetical protein [Allopontixanthobacter sp.]|uniref:hypothetical protein n=1 Tax=Allopontixanthobacter sp. TaxID=2906452 RepID=UPI002AB98004|nr:hypothetical protein [Allopontixanthobacter sp.]MDZ4306719.1 hypothetical protein [Allopontixanthobacter sp.]
MVKRPFLSAAALSLAPLFGAHSQTQLAATIDQGDLASISQSYTEAWSSPNIERIAALFSEGRPMTVNDGKSAALAQQIASFITGTTLTADGGFHLTP